MAITSLTKMLYYPRSDDRDLVPLVAPTTDLGANSTGNVTGIGIGFTFTFNGVDYTTCALFAYGFLRLAGTEASNGNGNLFAANTNILLAPWWDNIKTADTVGYLKHETQGTAPFRRFVVEWYAKLNALQTSSNTERGKFQLVLYETKNKIEFRYGSLEVIGTPDRSSYSASIGVKGDTSSVATNRLDYASNTRTLGASDTSSTSNLAAPGAWPAATHKLEPNWPMCGRYVHIPPSQLSGLQHFENEPAWAIANNVNWLRCNFAPALVNLSPVYWIQASPAIACPITPSVDGRSYRVWIETYSSAGGNISVDVMRDNAANPQPLTGAHWSSLTTNTAVGTAVGYHSWTSFTVTIPSSATYLRFAFSGGGTVGILSVLVAPDSLSDFDPTVSLSSGWQWMGLGQLRQEGAAIHPEWYNRAYRNIAKLAADLKQMLWSFATHDGSDALVSGTAALPVRVAAIAPAAMPGWRAQTATGRVWAYDSVDGGKLVFGERGGGVTSQFTINSNSNQYRMQSSAIALVSDEPTIFVSMDPAGNARIATATVEWTPPLDDVDLIEGPTPIPRLEYLLALVSRIRRLSFYGWSMTGLAAYFGILVWRCAWIVPPATKALKAKVARLASGNSTATYTSIYGLSSGAGGVDEIRIEPPSSVGTDGWPPDKGPVTIVSCSDRFDASPTAASDRLLESPTATLLSGGVRERITIERGVGVTLVPQPADPSAL